MNAARPNRVINEGHLASSVVIHVPHARAAIPADVRVGIDLHDDELRHLAGRVADLHLDDLAKSGVYGLRPAPSMIVNQLSRLVVDGDGGLADVDESGDGVLLTIPDGRALRVDDANERAVLVDQFIAPYVHDATELIERSLTASGRCTVLDLHATDATTHGVTVSMHGPISEHANLVVGALVDDLGDGVTVTTASRTASPHFLPDTRRFAGGTVSLIRLDISKDLYLRSVSAVHPQRARALAHALRRLIARLELAPLIDDYRASTIRAGRTLPADGFIITACNPFSTQVSDDENARAMQQLRDALDTREIEAIDITVGTQDWSEPSLFVSGLSRADACSIGRTADQFALYEIDGDERSIVACANDDVVHTARIESIAADGGVIMRELP